MNGLAKVGGIKNGSVTHSNMRKATQVVWGASTVTRTISQGLFRGTYKGIDPVAAKKAALIVDVNEIPT